MLDKKYRKLEKKIENKSLILSDAMQKKYEKYRKKIDKAKNIIKDIDKDFFEELTTNLENKERQEKATANYNKNVRIAGELIYKNSGEEYLDSKFIDELKIVIKYLSTSDLPLPKLFEIANREYERQKEQKAKQRKLSEGINKPLKN